MPLAALLALPLLISQAPVVEGQVLDARTGAPVAGAGVKLRYSTSLAGLDESVTGASGSFHFFLKDPGMYAIEAAAPGYQTALSDTVSIADGEFEADASPRVHSVTLKLNGAGALSGRIRDAETTRPLQLITVRVLNYRWLLGKRILTEAGVVFTDAEGAFRAASLPAGDYILEVQRNPPETARSKIYPRVYWPQTGMTVLPGAEAGAGTLDYARISIPKVRITVVSDCKETPFLNLAIVQIVGQAEVKRPELRRTVSCAAPLPPLSLAPGQYRIEATAQGPSGFRMASAEVNAVEGEDRDIELKPPPANPEISGRILCECDRTSISVSVNPAADSADSGMRTESRVESDGTFHIPVLFAGAGIVEVKGLPAGYYVKKPALLTFAAGSAPFFEIELSDQAAKVTIGAPPGHVLLAPWPLNLPADYSALRTAEIAGDAALFSDIAPGPYRAVWISPDDWPKLHMPSAIRDWLAGSETFTLAEGEAKSISIRSPKP